MSAPAKKSPSNTPNRPGKHGGLLRSGNLGNKGGGRPRNAWKVAARQMLDDPKVQDEIEKIVTDAKHPQFASVLKLLDARAHGAPMQQIAVGKTDNVLLMDLPIGEEEEDEE